MIQGVTSIGIPRGKPSRRRFIPPPRKIAEVQWSSISQMRDYVNVPLGDWKLSTNQWGHLQGLPHKVGVKVALGRGNKMLFWDGNTTIIEVCHSNFVGHNEERE